MSVPENVLDEGLPTSNGGPSGSSTLQVVAPQRTVREHFQDIVRYHQLLRSLVRKELKVKYKNSTLGFAWSLLNPLLYLVVYYFVFDVLLGSAIEAFPIFLLSGLLVWNLFATSLVAGTSSIAESGSLIKKVFFPREVLPLSSEGAALVHFFLQFFVLVLVMLVVRWNVDPAYVWLVVPALLVMLVLAASFAVLLSAVNVYARDVKHLIEVVLLAWFWLTPIVYQWGLYGTHLGRRGLTWIVLLNPVTPIVLAFQRAIYNKTTTSTGTVLLPDGGPFWYFRNLLIVGAAAFAFLLVSVRVFDRLEGNFAEVI